MTPARCITGTLFALAACWAAAAQSENLLEARDRIEWDAGGLYEGRFPDGTPFQIELAYPAPGGLDERAKDVMQSAYWYPRHFTGPVLGLSARRDAGGAIHLAPSLDGGPQAQERFTINLGANRLRGTGTWTSGRPGKPLAFSLKRLVLYRAIAVTRPSPAARAEGSDQLFSFTALFPVLHDSAVNAWARGLLADCRADLQCANKVVVRWHSPALMSLQASTWTYSQGAAHGQYRSVMRHYALGDGAPVHTRFTGFVAASTACRDKVSTALVAKLRAQGLSWPEQGVLDDMQDPRFTPTPTGIAFGWDPYEVGSYSQGAPGVFLTRAELGDCVSNLPRYD
jgi:hypothetical protein